MSRYFWMYYLLGLCSFTSQATLIPPPGFESLLEGQTEQIEVLLPGHSLGLFPVVVKPDTVQFMSPLMVLESSGLAALPAAERQKALAALSRPLLRNSNLVCGVSEAKDSSECGYVATDKEDVAVIFDENNAQLSLFLNRDWLPDEERRDKRWLTPTPEGVSAFIHRQTLYLSDDLHSHNMTLNGSGALGLGDGRYLGGNWAAIWNQSEHYNNSQTWFDNLFVRQDLGNQYYLQAGRMDQRNLSSATGGDFGFSLLPLSRFDGLRTGTTQAYVNHEVDQNATPVMVQVTRNARIDIYRGSELLGSQFLTPGMLPWILTLFHREAILWCCGYMRMEFCDERRASPSVRGVIASVHRPSGLFRAGRKIPGIKPAIMTVRLSWLPDSELGCGKISV